MKYRIRQLIDGSWVAEVKQSLYSGWEACDRDGRNLWSEACHYHYCVVPEKSDALKLAAQFGASQVQIIPLPK